MKKQSVAWIAVSATLLLGTMARADIDAAGAFDQIKALAGTWEGSADGSGEAEAESIPAAVHRFEISAGGTVVMETMSPGSEYEMINMYHVDGEDLVVTHYCSGGNQPRMRLNRQVSSADKLVFDFDGGTNLDPARDHHIHAAEIRLVGEDRLDSIWQGYSGGAPAGEMTFHLSRAGDNR